MIGKRATRRQKYCNCGHSFVHFPCTHLGKRESTKAKILYLLRTFNYTLGMCAFTKKSN